MSESIKDRKKQLFSTKKNGYDRISQEELPLMEAYCKAYRHFLDHGKIERECAAQAVELAQKAGFVEFQRGMTLHAGDKVYTCNRGKSVVLAVIGQKSLSEGSHIVACHIDSPRLDLKPNPLYEEAEMAYFKTHYYGGIR